jgi:hypothetical protein
MVETYRWSNSEKIIARRAFDQAYERECTEIVNTVKNNISDIKDINNIWKIEKYLHKKRSEIDAKYDYRYSVLIIVFGKLMAEGFITINDIEGLGQEKIEAIIRIGANKL